MFREGQQTPLLILGCCFGINKSELLRKIKKLSYRGILGSSIL